jgi:hypothetical protein
MTRGWETNGVGAGRRRVGIRPIRRRTDTGSSVRRILEGHEAALGEAVVRILAAGGGLLFSATRDGGAVGVHLYQGDTRASEFVVSNDDFGALCEALGALNDEQMAQDPQRGVKGPGTGTPSV